jgi:O-antigen/teichoic acid export membrane protein
MADAEAPTGPADEGADGQQGPTDPGGPVGSLQAAEAAVEGAAGAVSLAPSSVMPALGGELVLPVPGADDPDQDAAVDRDSVRAGILQAGPLAIAGFFANLAGVIVTVALARLLVPRAYGELNSLTGVFLIVSMPGSAVIVAVVRRVTDWRGQGSAHVVQRWAARIHTQGTVLVCVFSIAVLLARNWLASVLGQPHAAGLVAVLIAGAVWVLLCLDRGLLQGHRSYWALSGNLALEAGVRTAAMMALVAAGFGAVGGAIGILIAEVVTAVHARVMADRAWSIEAAGAAGSGTEHHGVVARLRARLAPDPATKVHGVAQRDLVRDFGFAFVALAMVALLQNVDVIVVHKYHPGIAGAYAAVSVACKALVFGAVVLGGYLLPEAAIRWHEGGHALRQLAVTLLLLSVPATALLIVALGFPDLLLREVYGAKYLGAAGAFTPLVLAMVCLSGTVVMTMYLLAVGRRWITGLLIVGGAAATGAVLAAHGLPVDTAWADLEVQAGLVLATTVGFVGVHRRRLRRG